jgi:serine/threonine protein kinase
MGVRDTALAASSRGRSVAGIRLDAQNGVGCVMTARPAPGSLVGRYRIVRLLGEGGMGAVHEAEDPEVGRRVALKVLAPGDDAFIERFRREAKLAAAVRHANVATLHASGEHEGQPYLVFELVEGGSLGDRLKRGALPWDEAARLASGVARGLAAIHAAGLVHRDVKPANVLLDSEGRPKLADFGLARRIGGLESEALTRTGEILGTFEFVAPEQIESARTVDARTDLYALGALLHALVAGAPPFSGTAPELMKHHLIDAPPALRSLAPETPARLERLVLALLEKEPSRRPASASEVAAELDAIVKGKPARVDRRLLALAPLVVVAAVVVALLASSWSTPEPPAPRWTGAPAPPPPSPSTPSPLMSPAAAPTSRWDVAALASKTLDGDGKFAVRALAVSSDGKQLLAGRENCELELWSVEARTLKLWMPHKHSNNRAVSAIAFDPTNDGRAISAGEDGAVALTNLASGDDGNHGHEDVNCFDHQRPCCSACFSPDGTAFMVDDLGQVFHWRVGESARYPSMRRDYSLDSVAVSPDGKWVAFAGDERGRTELLAPADVVLYGKLDHAAAPLGRRCRVAFTSDGRELLRAGGQTLERLSVPALTSVERYSVKGAEIVALDVRGDRVLTASRDGAIRLWATPSFDVVTSEKVAETHGAPLDARLTGPDSFVVGTDRGEILLYEPRR